MTVPAQVVQQTVEELSVLSIANNKKPVTPYRKAPHLYTMLLMSWLLAITFIALRVSYLEFTEFRTEHPVDVCAQSSLEDNAAELLQWSSSKHTP